MAQLDIRTPDGLADCYAYAPAGPGPFPAVLFFMDGIGIRPALHQMAQRVAAAGYYVLMPNMFYRAGTFPPFDAKSVFGDPAERERLMGLIKSVTTAGAMADVAAFLEAMAKQPGVRAERMGTMGYCLGGRLALTAAGHFPERFAAAASIHGGGLVTPEPDSPHLLAAKIRARLYFAVADNDRSCTPENQATLAAALTAAGVRHQLEVYPGAAHGFAVGDTPVYDAAAAEKHWERVLTLFGETLR